MLYINALYLVQEACKHDVMMFLDREEQGRNQRYVFVYRMANELYPEKFPEGYYPEPIEDVAREVMESEEAQSLIYQALAEKGVKKEDIPWYEKREMDVFFSQMESLYLPNKA